MYGAPGWSQSTGRALSVMLLAGAGGLWLKCSWEQLEQQKRQAYGASIGARAVGGGQVFGAPGVVGELSVWCFQEELEGSVCSAGKSWSSRRVKCVVLPGGV